MKNGHGRFFHLDHGQLFEGFWVDDVAKCGTMIDFGRDEAPEPTQFPIPKVSEARKTETSIHSPTSPGAIDVALFASKVAWGLTTNPLPLLPSR